MLLSAQGGMASAFLRHMLKVAEVLHNGLGGLQAGIGHVSGVSGSIGHGGLGACLRYSVGAHTLCYTFAGANGCCAFHMTNGVS